MSEMNWPLRYTLGGDPAPDDGEFVMWEDCVGAVRVAVSERDREWEARVEAAAVDREARADAVGLAEDHLRALLEGSEEA